MLDLYTLRKWTENYHAENHAHCKFADCPLAPCWISLKAGDGGAYQEGYERGVETLRADNEGNK